VFGEEGNFGSGTWGKKGSHAGCWWLRPVILVTQEAEIRRSVVLGK
jgi:hypothetical protein